MKTQETPGETVARLRKAKDWTANALAVEAGVAPSVVYRLESGERLPGLSVLRRITAALEASLAVFDGPDSPCVYLARKDGRWKIGASKNAAARSTSLNAELIHRIESRNHFWLEKIVHRRFADKALGREWFALSEEDVALVRSLGRCHSAEQLPEWLKAAAGAEPPPSSLAAIVKGLMMDKGWTMDRLGKNARVGDVAVRSILAGREPKLEVARKVFAALGGEGRAAWAAMLA